MSDTVYFKNRAGGVHSCTREHWNQYLTEWIEGVRYPKIGFTEISEDEAREEHPQLFGARDPEVDRHMTAEEQTRALDRAKNESRLIELSAANLAARKDDN